MRAQYQGIAVPRFSWTNHQGRQLIARLDNRQCEAQIRAWRLKHKIRHVMIEHDQPRQLI